MRVVVFLVVESSRITYIPCINQLIYLRGGYNATLYVPSSSQIECYSSGPESKKIEPGRTPSLKTFCARAYQLAVYRFCVTYSLGTELTVLLL